MPNEQMKFTVEKAQIIFPNFSGREDQYNREGNRNFSILLDPDIADQLAADGWNVKTLKVREEGDEPQPYITIAVSYKIRPPQITLITSTGRKMITEDMVEALDGMEFSNVDLICIASHWSRPNGDSGIKAYLKTMFLTLEEDELQRKYAKMEVEGRG